MVYGNFAKSLNTDREGTFNEYASESNFMIEFLIRDYNEQSSFLNESYITESERMVAEARLQALQEAVGTIIIAAIVGVLAAIIAFIIKFISMTKKAANRIKDAFSEFDFYFAEPTEEQIKIAKEKIDTLVDSLNYSNKDKLKKFSDVDFVQTVINLKLNTLFANLLTESKDIVSAASSTSLDTVISKSNSVLSSLTELRSTLNIEQLKQEENSFFKAMESSSTISLDIEDSMRIYKDIKKFYIDGKYFDRAEKMQTQINKDATTLKDYLSNKSNMRSIQKLHPDDHIGDDNSKYEEAFKTSMSAFQQMKDIIQVAQKLMIQWQQAEQFRLRYINIIIGTMNNKK